MATRSVSKSKILQSDKYRTMNSISKALTKAILDRSIPAELVSLLQVQFPGATYLSVCVPFHNSTKFLEVSNLLRAGATESHVIQSQGTVAGQVTSTSTPKLLSGPALEAAEDMKLLCAKLQLHSIICIPYPGSSDLHNTMNDLQVPMAGKAQGCLIAGLPDHEHSRKCLPKLLLLADFFGPYLSQRSHGTARPSTSSSPAPHARSPSSTSPPSSPAQPPASPSNSLLPPTIPLSQSQRHPRRKSPLLEQQPTLAAHPHSVSSPMLGSPVNLNATSVRPLGSFPGLSSVMTNTTSKGNQQDAAGLRDAQQQLPGASEGPPSLACVLTRAIRYQKLLANATEGSQLTQPTSLPCLTTFQLESMDANSNTTLGLLGKAPTVGMLSSRGPGLPPRAPRGTRPGISNSVADQQDRLRNLLQSAALQSGMPQPIMQQQGANMGVAFSEPGMDSRLQSPFSSPGHRNGGSLQRTSDCIDFSSITAPHGFGHHGQAGGTLQAPVGPWGPVQQDPRLGLTRPDAAQLLSAQLPLLPGYSDHFQVPQCPPHLLDDIPANAGPRQPIGFPNSSNWMLPQGTTNDSYPQLGMHVSVAPMVTSTMGAIMASSQPGYTTEDQLSSEFFKVMGQLR